MKYLRFIFKAILSTITLLSFYSFSNDLKVNIDRTKSKIVLKRQNENPQIVVQGIIVDASTDGIIPYCSVSALNSNIGTASNELGEFEIKVGSLPIELHFSHINYQNQTITISSVSDNLIVKLTPLVNNSHAVTHTENNEKTTVKGGFFVFGKTESEI